MGELNRVESEALADAVGAIRHLSRGAASNILHIGHHLLNAKKVLGAARFPGWVGEHFAWTMGHVRAMIRVAAVFAAVPRTTLDRFDPTALCLLADRSTPPAARESAIAAADNGTRITHQSARELVRLARPSPAQKPPRKLKDSATASAGVEERPEERLAWAALEQMAARATVRLGRVPDTDEDDPVARPWSVHVYRDGGEPDVFVCKDSLASAVTLAAGVQPEITCKNCNWTGPAFHGFSRKAGTPLGRSFNCRRCETWRVGAMKKVNRGTAKAGELPDLPPSRRQTPDTPKGSPATPTGVRRKPKGG